jgi:hypothetical protein
MADAKEAKKPAPKKAEGGNHTELPREQKKCREEGCKVPYKAKGYCVKHYRLWRQHKLGKKQRYKVCGKEGCRKPMVRWGLCEEHYKAAQVGEGAVAGGGEPTAAPAAT